MTNKAVLIAAFIYLLFTIGSFATNPVSAQVEGQITVLNSSIQEDYPRSLSFSCEAQSNANITDIRLDYQVQQMTFVQETVEAKIEFTSSNSVSASYLLNTQRYGQIPQGVVIDYWWIVKDVAGNRLQTQPNHFTVVDNLHKWNNLTQGKINLYWYGQNQSFGQTVMTEAQSALTILAQDTGATPNQTVNISIYNSNQDYTASVIGVPEWSGGVELSQYNTILVIINPSVLSSELPVIAHELTHVIVGQITFNTYNTIPFWLNEGLAMHIQFPQGNLPFQFTTALSNGFNGNSLISVRSLSDPFSAYADKANLSYAESDSLVTYLINKYGSSKMKQFLISFEQGTSYDEALQANYGFDMDGLFTQWKTWVSQAKGQYPVY
jgi:hypothetical protein